MKKRLLLMFLFSAFLLGAKEVIYIPGWLTEKATFDQEERLLKDTFPGYSITVKPWASGTPRGLIKKNENESKRELLQRWNKARNNSELFAAEIVRYIAAMPPEQQRETILIGHSLGGRCTVFAAAQLKKENIKINRVILLGSAVNNSDERLKECGEVSLLPALNIYNYRDSVLRFAYANCEHSRAAGQVGTKTQLPNLLNFRIADSDGTSDTNLLNQLLNGTLHFSENYIGEIKNRLNATPVKEKIDHDAVWENITIPALIPEYFSFPLYGKVIETHHDWVYSYFKAETKKLKEIIKQKFNKDLSYLPDELYIITDPRGQMMIIPASRFLADLQWNQIKGLINAQL